MQCTSTCLTSSNCIKTLRDKHCYPYFHSGANGCSEILYYWGIASKFQTPTWMVRCKVGALSSSSPPLLLSFRYDFRSIALSICWWPICIHSCCVRHYCLSLTQLPSPSWHAGGLHFPAPSKLDTTIWLAFPSEMWAEMVRVISGNI